MLDLPTDRPRSSAAGMLQYLRCVLPEQLCQGVRHFSSVNAVAPSTTFFSVLQVYLHRYTGQEDTLVGVSAAGHQRDNVVQESITPVLTKAVGARSFSALVKDISNALHDAHLQASRSERIPLASDPGSFRFVSDTEFQIAFSFRSSNGKQEGALAAVDAGQLRRNELFVEIVEQEDFFVLSLGYDASLYDAATVERMQRQYSHLLEAILASPDLLPEHFSIVPDKERQVLIYDWNQTEADYPEDKCIHELFAGQARETPDKPAVVCREQCLTYRELDHRSAVLAKWLQSQGIGPDVLVGLCVERSLEMIVGLLGVLRAGGAYVPLGPEYPQDRLKYMAQDSGVRFILTQEHLIAGVTAWAGEQVQVVALDRDWELMKSDVHPAGEPPRNVRPDDLAYLMYTSGSTGRPKGVMIPHRALTNFLVSMGRQPGLQSTDRLLAVTTYCFDISGLELYLPLLKGAQCFICNEEVARDGKKLLQEIRTTKPTVMQATPATWTMLFHAGWNNEERMKILCGGEALPDTLRRKFAAADCDVWNMYGPTETTIWSTLHHLTGGKHANIGRPIANTQIYIVDKGLRPVPVGVAGELCIAGDGLAKGYWKKPDITAEKFISNPFTGASKLYRTGDLARWCSDGTIDYLGRIDHQVKIRGFRIELGEIESQLNQHPSIQDCVVVVKSHEETQHLVGYYISRVSEPLEPQSLREHLKGRLPDYMVPNLFVHLRVMPLTPNGKTDRKALMERDVELSRTKILLPPESALEQQIWSIWKDILPVVNIGADDSFFDVGGTSVSATALVERINQAFGCGMTLATLFSHTTIRQLSRYVSSTVEGQESARSRTLRQGHLQRGEDVRAGTIPIAIVGMAGRFPGSADLTTFWRNVEQGRNCITGVPESRWSWKSHYGDPVKEKGKTRVKWGGFIDGVGEFDPLFFGIAPREAELMDPQQRLLMTYSWLALEHAGIAPSSFSKQTTGVFIAASAGEYRDCIAVDAEDSVYGITSETAAMIPSRISYALNLHGPSELCETTCSSSLVAVHRAIQSMRSGECEQAIVGGVNLLLSPEGFSRYEAMGLLSTHNEVKSFQAGASGYLRAEGVGVVVLKPLTKALADGDVIYALLKGSGVSHGGKGMSLTAPNAEGMKWAMIRAYAAADVHPRTVEYIETHGIASPVGDSIEIDALKSGYKNMVGRYETDADTESACYLSCLKPTMGHGEIVSGIAALIKVVFALRHQVIPGLPRFTELHEALSLAGTPFQITRHCQSWRARYDDRGEVIPRRASINSYGFGASAHLVLEEYVPVQEGGTPFGQAPAAAPEIVVLSAKSKDRLKAMADNLRTFLQTHPQTALRDLAYTLQIGRESMRERLAILASNVDELMQRLACFTGDVNSPDRMVLCGAVPEAFVSHDALETDLVKAWSKRDLEAVARAWVNGAEVPWSSLDRAEKVNRVALPTYPFERKTYWAGRESPSAVEVNAPTKRTSTKKRICVVGAGPAGLVMAKSLLEEGHEAVVYESGDTLGGIWNLKEQKNSGVYKSTRFQNSTDTSFFSDFPPNAEHGLFPGVRQVRDYLEAYAERFGLKRMINYGCKVVAVTEAGEQWRVEVSRGSERQIHHFDGVALCHGRYRHPAVPDIEGLNDFRGEVLHSGQYYDNRIFAGKRVLVIGNGVSGMDIAEEASHVAQAVYWSMRSLKFVLPRLVGYLPNDFISPANLLTSPDNSVILERLKQSMPDYYAAYQKSGLFPDVEAFRANPFVHINDGVIQRVADGAIQTFVEDVERFTTNGCIFKTSGTKIEGVDIVVMCIGYDDMRSFDYVKDISVKDDLAMGLFYRRNPSLVNTYGIQDVGTTGTLPYLEMVARWYAQVISGHYHFSEEELEHRIDMRDIVVAPLSNVIIGLKLGLLPRPEQEFRAFWRCLNMPSFPPMYRLRGPHADPQAQTILSKSIQRSFIQQDDQDPTLQKVKYRLLAGLGDQVMRDLLARQEITAEEFRRAQDYQKDPIVLSWGTQFIKRVRKDAETAGDRSTVGKVKAGEMTEAVFLEGVKHLMGRTLKLDPRQIGLEQNLSDYGFSSVTLTAFSQKIFDEYGIRLAPVTFIEHATLKALTAFMYQRLPDGERSRFEAPVVVRHEKTDSPDRNDGIPESVHRASNPQDIAIIGLGGRFPGARSLSEFWRNLLENRSPVALVPEERWSWKACHGDPEQADKTDCHHGAFVEDVADFDPLHFHLSPREAVFLDPQQRLLLEATWETLENAGYAKSALFGKKVGCFIGVERQDYASKIRSLGNPVDGYLNTGNSHAMLVNRVSHYFGWKGPTLAVDTACSSSFTALHAALRSLQHGDAELALAGGVNLVLAPDVVICNRRLGLFTGEDHVKPFDRDAAGHFFSDGLGLVLLKPLASAQQDGDHIYGVVKGMSVRHGGQGVMLTFPNPMSHREVIEETLLQARLDPSDIDYIEGQGTANPVADSVELKAYHQIFSKRARPVPVGTVKGHMGHFAAASGVIALIKALLSLKNNQLIRVENFKALNWEPDDEPFSCEVLSQHQAWPSKWVRGRQVPRRIGIHNFGFGGVTGHLILEEHLPSNGRQSLSASAERDSLIVLSTRNADQLIPMTERLLRYLDTKEYRYFGFEAVELRDIAYTLQVGREAMVHRMALLAKDLPDLIRKLKQVVNSTTLPDDCWSGVADAGTSVSLDRATFERASLRDVARFWLQGQLFDWNQLHGAFKPRKIVLPTFPFARARYWVQAPGTATTSQSSSEIVVSAAMPDEVKGMIPTLNGTGTMTKQLLSCSESFVAYAGQCEGEVLDLGCAYGGAALSALERGAHVVAVDMEPRHLEILKNQVHGEARNRISTQQGVLPTLDFADNRFAAIHAGRVLHFLRPEAFQHTMAKMFRWLQPGGKLFLTCDTPYFPHWAAKLSDYEAGKAAGSLWPGYIENLGSFFSLRTEAGAGHAWDSGMRATEALQGVEAINLIDPDILRRESIAAGFHVEKVGFEGLAVEVNGARVVDGFEHVGLIAVKPFAENDRGIVRTANPYPARDAAGKNHSIELQPSAVFKTIKTMLAGELGIREAELPEEAKFFDLGLNSAIGVSWMNRINETYGLSIPAAKLFSYPTLQALTRYLLEQGNEQGLFNNVDKPRSPKKEMPHPEPLSKAKPFSRTDETRIAVIGISCRFPGSRNKSEFWDSIRSKRDCICEVPANRWSMADYYDEDPESPGKTDCRFMGALEEADCFDPMFFKISPLEARHMDPQQRLFLEAAWSCLEDAGYATEAISGSRCGVFAGYGNYGQDQMACEINAQRFIGGSPSILAARISYLLNLQGPSLTIDTACSASLVAVAQACNSLLLGDCDLALAGGVSVLTGPAIHIMASKAGMLSKNGRCFTLDQRANGFVPGEGVGVIALKRLADAQKDGDLIYGVVRGWGVNQDGSTNGITAPNQHAQVRLQREVYDRFGIDPAGIQYVEMHGTGTKLGDPIEVDALIQSFQAYTDKQGFCALGSVKSNVGHTLAAAGIAGVIKMLMAFKYRHLPPAIHVEQVNEHIGLANSPFYINTECKEWKVQAGEQPRAAVSSFGYSGTNAHVVLEAHEDLRPATPEGEKGPYPILFSARNNTQLQAMIKQLLEYVTDHASLSLANLAYTLQVGRMAMEERIGLIVDSTPDLIEKCHAVVAGNDADNVYRGQMKQHDDILALFSEDERATCRARFIAPDIGEMVEVWMKKRKYSKLLMLWVNGFKIDWHQLYDDASAPIPHRISLPTYPFARESYRQSVPLNSSSDEHAHTPGFEQGSSLTQATSSLAATAIADDRRSVRYLTKQWEPVPAKPDPSLGEKVAILATWETESLATELLRILPEAEVLYPENIHALLERSDPSSGGFVGCIDLIGCGQERHESLECVEWLRRLVAVKSREQRMLLCVSRGLETYDNLTVNLSGASRVGLYRMLQSEYAALQSRHVDADPSISGDALAKQIAAEFCIRDQVPEVCYRNGQRYKAVLREATGTPRLRKLMFSEREVVWITGGTRGLGLLCAQHFVKHYGVKRLLLTGREQWPPRHEWPDCIARNHPRARQMSDVLALIEQGIEVLVMSIPMARDAAVRESLASVRQQIGPIRGVIHCAGTMDTETLAFIRKSVDGFRQVLSPKVAGLDLLLSQVSTEPLRCVILFSSVAGMIPTLGAGQSDYAMANAYMDYVASAKVSNCPIISIQWPHWVESEQGELKSGAYARTGLLSHTHQEGLQLLDEVLSCDLGPVVLPALVNPDQWQPEQLMNRKIAEPGAEASPGPLEMEAPTVPLDPHVSSDAVRTWLIRLFCKELEIPPERIQADTDFQQYGADSILLSQFTRTIGKALARPMDPSVLFEYSTIESLAAWLIRSHGEPLREILGIRSATGAPSGSSSTSPAASDKQATSWRRSASTSKTETATDAQPTDIAVIGMSCRFPGARNLDAYWRLLCEGRNAITRVPRERWGRPTSFYAGLLDSVVQFDSDFFQIPEADARLMDPQALLVLEETLNLFCHAGYSMEEMRGTATGVYLGGRSRTHDPDSIVRQAKSPIVVWGQNYLGANVSHFFDLKGPSMVIDTACSSALVAMHSAIESLCSGENQFAIVGGVNLLTDDLPHRIFQQRNLLSPNHAFHIFDQRASGVVLGEGVGLVLLKPRAQAEKDGDTIYALIKALAINNDGRTAGPTTPSIQAQKAVMQAALAKSGKAPWDISFIEANGSGSEVTDLLELKAMEAVYRSSGRTPCGVGSIKPNIGHPLCAEGIAGFIKLALMLNHKQHVPFLSGTNAMTHYSIDNSPFFFHRANEPWSHISPVAALNCFADGGTNAHLIVEAWEASESKVARRQPIVPPLLHRKDLRQHHLAAGNNGAGKNWWGTVLPEERVALT